MVSEQRSITTLVKRISDTFDVRVWQDGTKSDIGVRPLGSQVDAWYPLQLKSSNVEPVKFYMRGKDGKLPVHDTICMSMTRIGKRPGVYFFTVDDIANMGIGTRGTMSGFRHDRLRHEHHFLTFDTLKALLLEKYSQTGSKFPEWELRYQTNVDMRRELAHIMMSNRMRPESVTSWPETPMDVFDQWRDGEREQYKSAVRDGNGFACPNFAKKMACEKVPYELGDCHWYVFGNLENGLYIEWRLPETLLDDWGMLSRRSRDGKSIIRAGKMSIQLQLPIELQMEIVGKPMRSDVDCRTADYVRVLKV
tara:strand:- start:1136 stop:2056 length:921 start_codon:yes stop_codon:yes gene_type:complete